MLYRGERYARTLVRFQLLRERALDVYERRELRGGRRKNHKRKQMRGEEGTK